MCEVDALENLRNETGRPPVFVKPSRYMYPLARKGICTSLAPHAFGDDENCLKARTSPS